MAFIFGKWRILSEIKKTKEKYGENGNIMTRAKVIKLSGQNHSFPHLINKNFPVKVLDLPEFYSNEKPHRSFHITDKQKQTLRINK